MISVTAARRGGILVLALVAFALVAAAVVYFLPRRDPLPAQLARKDEKAASHAAVAVGADLAARNDGATVHIDLTTKEVRDAFQSIPAPVPSSPTDHNEPRALPAAPVDRLRDRLNESIARANRSAGAANPPD